MGQSRGGGYTKKETLLQPQMNLLQKILQQGTGNTDAAAEGFKQFLPGGGGGQAFKDLANQNYQQQTIPSILNAFGSNSKGSSALNQALASSAANLNSSLAAQIAQMQLGASQGLGNLGANSQAQGLNTPGFAYLQRQPSLLQQLLQTGISGGSSFAGGLFG